MFCIAAKAANHAAATSTLLINTTAKTAFTFLAFTFDPPNFEARLGAVVPVLVPLWLPVELKLAVLLLVTIPILLSLSEVDSFAAATDATEAEAAAAVSSE